MGKESHGVIRKKVKLDLELTDPDEARTAKIRTEYLERKGKEKVSAAGYAETIGPADKLRAHILAMSLFPNVYNGQLLNPSS